MIDNHHDDNHLNWPMKFEDAIEIQSLLPSLLICIYHAGIVWCITVLAV